ncbi:menaquinone biosynthesis protein [Geomonas nitrogeniifigens]|uniref:Chorismate dehydratase n=1 Tax=Geomonas diazotrophica TaxID=2843197 RepID=A0ABX8JCC2_9BACT|nr:menaquinone biosynthesis protein [Geomonas nitrogeniifigens]QWV96020.1 menaquinone biosynthesis protein [Geomonas nitrogeniifigens]QXE85087.1 menaquinone biosynthesis protein [Geomonas nitrogeniifigens]
MTINIGHIKYANCTPIFTALASNFDCTGYRFVDGVPARLNAMLRAGEIDLSPSSSIEYAMAHEQYCLLPELSISAIGPVKSVFLFSRVPVEELDGKVIGLTAESDTSVNLLKVLLARKFGFSNSFERTTLPLHQALEEYPGLLLIGDAALKGAASGSGFFCYDLGQLWHEFTGLPFVFALWIVRREAALEKRAELAALARDLVAAKKLAYASYAEIAAQCEERGWLSEEALVDYWQTISYELTDAHLEGARLFFRHAFEMGLIPSLPVLRFFE